MWFYLSLAVLLSVYDLDIAFLIIGALIAKLNGYHREQKFIEEDVESKQNMPLSKVLIQLPMYNEDTHCNLIMKKCCDIRWPQDKLLIQVLDDSTKDTIKNKVDEYARNLQSQNYPITVIRRSNRNGYKAGAMSNGLDLVKDSGFKYVAVFDADFEPLEDFLEETIPILERDSQIGFVQTQWKFGNVNSFLTWCQKINLQFHFSVEQLSRGYMGAF